MQKKIGEFSNLFLTLNTLLVFLLQPFLVTLDIETFHKGYADHIKHNNQEKAKAAKLFVKFMATDEVWASKLVNATGGFPASSKIELDYTDSEILYNSVLQRFFGQYYNNITGFSKMRQHWNEALNAIGHGQDTQKVLNQFVLNANNTLREE